MNLPSFESYGEYSSDNYGVNSLVFKTDKIDVYFSYKTPVAFNNGHGLIVRQNEWGPTTGKHLNWIDGGGDAKKQRIDGAEFEKRLSEAMK